MKTLLTLFFFAAVLVSCGGSDGEARQDETKVPDTIPTAPDPTALADSEKGLELIGASDCTACHAIDRKIIGPSYIDVAKKYEATQANIDTLVSKIKKGGMGNWGNIPMTPHPDLPDADVKDMVVYILSLRNK